MACSSPVPAGDAVGRVAHRRACHLFCVRSPILVACCAALAEPRQVAAVVSSFISFPRYITVRCAFGVSDVLQPRGLLALSVRASALQYFSSRRPGTCGRVDVGLGNVRLSGSGGRRHDPDALSAAAFLGSEGQLNIRFGCGSRMGVKRVDLMTPPGTD
jgi:hypothetical protein